MDPNNPTNDQQQIGQMSSDNSQVSADNSQMPSDNYQAPMSSQEPDQATSVAGVVAEPPTAPVTPQEEVAGGVAQVSEAEPGQQMMSESVQVSQEVPEQVNPVDASQYPNPTVTTAGTAPLGGEPSEGDNNPPQAV
jgi:hypothetical protein